MSQSESSNQEFSESAVEHIDALYRFALSLTSDEVAAKDLVQETYLKAYRFKDSFRQGTNIKAWLFQILKNTFINSYRRKQRSPITTSYEDVSEFYELVKRDDVDLDSLSKQLFRDAFDDEITRAMQELSDEFRIVLALSDIEDYSYEDIAEILEIPIGTVRSRLHRARAKMRGHLYEYAKQRGISKS